MLIVMYHFWMYFMIEQVNLKKWCMTPEIRIRQIRL